MKAKSISVDGQSYGVHRIRATESGSGDADGNGNGDGGNLECGVGYPGDNTGGGGGLWGRTVIAAFGVMADVPSSAGEPIFGSLIAEVGS